MDLRNPGMRRLRLQQEAMKQQQKDVLLVLENERNLMFQQSPSPNLRNSPINKDQPSHATPTSRASTIRNLAKVSKMRHLSNKLSSFQSSVDLTSNSERGYKQIKRPNSLHLHPTVNGLIRTITDNVVEVDNHRCHDSSRISHYIDAVTNPSRPNISHSGRAEIHMNFYRNQIYQMKKSAPQSHLSKLQNIHTIHSKSKYSQEVSSNDKMPRVYREYYGMQQRAPAYERNFKFPPRNKDDLPMHGATNDEQNQILNREDFNRIESVDVDGMSPFQKTNGWLTTGTITR